MSVDSGVPHRRSSGKGGTRTASGARGACGASPKSAAELGSDLTGSQETRVNCSEERRSQLE
eukprot:8314277-Alexandrium_andersonii.AAC.1